MTRVQNPSGARLAPRGDAAAAKSFSSWFRESHPGRELGIEAIQGRGGLQAAQGLKVGWILRGEARVQGQSQPLLPGDQVALHAGTGLDVEGNFSWAWIEDRNWKGAIPPLVQPLLSLPDTSGGCNVSPGAFRRLQITWNPRAVSPSNPDGDNRLNSHVVNIEEAFSTAHYHPPKAIGGGEAQEELYFVLDREPYGLPYGKQASVLLFPDPSRSVEFEKLALSPGDVAYFPPGLGHRGLDVFVNVIALPGFKPNNELPLRGTDTVQEEPVSVPNRVS